MKQEIVRGTWSGRQGRRISASVRRPSIRSAEAEERRRAYGVRDADCAFRHPARTREPVIAIFRRFPAFKKEALKVNGKIDIVVRKRSWKFYSGPESV